MMNIDKVLLLSLFGGYTCKLLALGANPSDAAIVLILAAAHFLYTSQIQNKDISGLKHQLLELRNIQLKQAEDISEVKSMASSVKIAAGLRPAK